MAVNHNSKHGNWERLKEMMTGRGWGGGERERSNNVAHTHTHTLSLTLSLFSSSRRFISFLCFLFSSSSFVLRRCRLIVWLKNRTIWRTTWLDCRVGHRRLTQCSLLQNGQAYPSRQCLASPAARAVKREGDSQCWVLLRENGWLSMPTDALLPWSFIYLFLTSDIRQKTDAGPWITIRLQQRV